MMDKQNAACFELSVVEFQLFNTCEI